MRGCPRNPNAQKGKATGSQSQGGGEAPPPVGPNAAESSNTYQSQSPYIASDAPYFGGSGSQIDSEGASTSMQSPPATVPGSAPRDLGILSAQNTAISDPNDHRVSGADLQFSAVSWENVSSPPSQGHVDGSAFSPPYNEAGSSDWYRTSAHPGMLPAGNQDTFVAQTLEESRFHRQPDTPTSQETTASLVQSSTVEITATIVMCSAPLVEFCATDEYARKPIPYPSTNEVAREALRGNQLPAYVVLAGHLRQPPQLSRPLSFGMRPRAADSSSPGFVDAMAELPFPIDPIAPTASFPEELRPPHYNIQGDVPGSPPP
jgi:hypothetical protein